MTDHQTITTSQVRHIAQLADIPITAQEEVNLADAFNETLEVVDKLKSVNVQNVEPTHQVTGLENIWREDKINQTNTFTQTQALANARQTHQGFFVVSRIIDQKDE